MKIYRCLKLIFVLTLFANLHTFAQKLNNPLESFDNSYSANFIGGQLGLGQNYQTGKFFTSCLDCEFKSGVASGYDFALFFEQEIQKNKLLWGVSLVIGGRNIQSKFTESEMLPFYLTNGDFYDSTKVSIDNTADIKLQMFSLVPYLKYQPLSFISLRLGPSFSFITSNNLLHTQSPTKSTLTLLNGQTAKIKTTDGTIQNSELKELNKTLIGIDFQLGFPMHLSQKWTFAPVFGYNYSFTNVSEYGENFKINTWRVLLDLKYQLNGAYEFKSKKSN